MKPTVGRIVHYYTDDEGPLASIITRIHDDGMAEKEGFVTLACFPPGITKVVVAPYSMIPEAGHWTWPPRE